MSSSVSFRTALIGVAVCASLAGCSEYMDRKDTIDLSAGNAVQTNVVTHVIDPWPVHARNKNISFSGERMQRAVHRYNCGPSGGGGPSNGGGNSITINNAPQAAASPGAC
jgi:hypothetical protein